MLSLYEIKSNRQFSEVAGQQGKSVAFQTKKRQRIAIIMQDIAIRQTDTDYRKNSEKTDGKDGYSPESLFCPDSGETGTRLFQV